MKKPLHYPHSGNRLWNDCTGLPYRMGGPALERRDGSKEWWFHGFQRYTQTGTTFWEEDCMDRASSINFPGYEEAP